MANIFKNKVISSIGTVEDGYTVPASTTTTVIGMTVSNRTTSNIRVDVTVVDTSAAVTAYLAKNILILPGSSIVPIGGDQKVVLEATDELNVVSDTASSADVVVSMMETV